ncbi:MAG: ROK family protein [Sediminibacterium sp.]
MFRENKRLGVDIGGSHASFSVVNINQEDTAPLAVRRIEINSFASAAEILKSISAGMREVFNDNPEISAVGIAFPGPFNYTEGISAVTGVGGKFSATFGIHVKQALKDLTGQHQLPFSFFNDAHCFATGAYNRHGLQSKRTVLLTLGTGLGAAFIKDGILLDRDESIPASGCFYDQDYLSGKAEDYISTRWFLQEYHTRTRETVSSVKELAGIGSPVSQAIFQQFGTNLGRFLLPWLKQFNCEELFIGGNITGAADLFGPSVAAELREAMPGIKISYCNDTEACILTGAALMAAGKDLPDLAPPLRKTTQPLLPVRSDKNKQPGYAVYPCRESAYTIYEGFDSLAERICREQRVVIDGFGGVLWEPFREQLQKALQKKNKTVFWYHIDACLHCPDRIDDMIRNNLNGNDPIFGKRYTGELADFFDPEKCALLQPDPFADICIVYGTGAALSNWKGLLVYLDVPKNEIQYRMRAGSFGNIGTTKHRSNTQQYKRCYFVDWPVLNRHKERLLPVLDCIADEQRIHTITWMSGQNFRDALNEMLNHAIRARPWFEAGIWGGDWMKNRITGLNKDEINYAWSFELITPENGIVLEGDSFLLEVSFDFLLYTNHYKLLGNAARRFNREFPIRFDFLDTYNGGNLSIQCHPRPAYIREKFGESFTQDETYYILDCDPGANVYLGFQEGINPAQLKAALVNAQEKAVEVKIEDYVQKLDAHKHDLFLIPNGTIHASGKNNLVLEISSTPYIFTFKMYDWLRLDLNGQPRPINIEHAYNNLYFDRQGSYVQEQLISHPIVEKEWDQGRKLKLPTHQEHFYTIDRYEFSGEVSIDTNRQCHCCMLVEGTAIEVYTGNKKDIFSYAETFIIPASVEQYRVCSKGKEKAFLVVAYVKENHC